VERECSRKCLRIRERLFKMLLQPIAGDFHS
jgi:hypothetical protein